MINSPASTAFDALFEQASTVTAVVPSVSHAPKAFVPLAPGSLAAAGLSEHQAEELILKSLLAEGAASGWDIAARIAVPFRVIEPLLHTFKTERLVIMKAAASLGDFVYELTELGNERASRYFENCSYSGAAPVPLEVYTASVAVQSLRSHKPTLEEVEGAFADLVLAPDFIDRLGDAMTAGLGFFLYGPPGNGKTSIAERVTSAYGTGVWIPRTISACGEIIRLFDPACHEPIAEPHVDDVPAHKIDRRWVYIRRPTIVAGGELALDHLEVIRNPATGIHEAPLQLKSNCGSLVIDDFGRQRASIEQLLNRWILPLERRYDLLSLSNGKKLRVPFDQLIVFATNLEPRDLVDEAFLRRIPYKIDMADPTESQFRNVWHNAADEMGIEADDAVLEHLLEKHYRQAGRPLRFCHARDLLSQVASRCRFRNVRAVATVEAIDVAVLNYFGVM